MRSVLLTKYIVLMYNYVVTIHYTFSLKMISLKHIINGYVVLLKDLSSLINISFAYARAAICIQMLAEM